ncbi:MAG TPA: hypothetical protein VFE65_18660 [Pseudonocardia sp.]|nr:hypothetical protein [Pseudonocardia sp.]
MARVRRGTLRGLARLACLLSTAAGCDQYEIAKAFGAEQAFSIGYKTRGSRSRNGVRMVDDLDLYEISGVPHGVNDLARLISVRSARPRASRESARRCALGSASGP